MNKDEYFDGQKLRLLVTTGSIQDRDLDSLDFFEATVLATFPVLSVHSAVIKGGEQGQLLVLRAQEMYFISFGGRSVLSKQALVS